MHPLSVLKWERIGSQRNYHNIKNISCLTDLHLALSRPETAHRLQSTPPPTACWSNQTVWFWPTLPWDTFNRALQFCNRILSESILVVPNGYRDTQITPRNHLEPPRATSFLRHPAPHPSFRIQSHNNQQSISPSSKMSIPNEALQKVRNR